MIILNILRTLRGIAITVLFFAFGVGTQIYFPVSFPGVVDKSSPRPDVDPSVLSAESIEIPRLKEIGYSVPVTFNSDAVFRGNIIINGTLFTADSIGAFSTASDPAGGTGAESTVRTYETIIASSGGVLSFQGMTGDLDLTAGTGISIDVLEITNTDPGSGQHIFKTIDVPGIGAIVAGANNDSLKLSAGSGINLAVDSNTKNIAISQNIANGLAVSGLVVAKDSTSLESLGPGPSGYILESRGDALPVWVDPGTLGASSLSFTDIASGTSSADLKIGNGSVLGAVGTGIINATQMQGYTWGSPGDIGLLSPARGKFTDLEASGQIMFPGLSSGIARIDPAGRMIASTINLESSDVTGFLPVTQGGTGGSTAAQARTNLGLGALALENTDTTSLTNYLPTAGGTLTGVVNSQSIIPTADSASNLGSSSKYWSNAYVDKINLRMDGLDVNTSQFVVKSKSASPVIGIGTANPLPASALSGRTVLHINDTSGNGAEFRLNSATAQGRFFNSNTFFGFGTDTNHTLNFFTNGGANTRFVIENNGEITFNQGILKTASNRNLSLIPNGVGFTIIGNAGTTSRGFNTNDDLFVSGRLEVDKLSYFDAGLQIQDSQAASVAAQIFNSSTGTNADGLTIKLGNPSATTVSPSNHFLSFETAGIGIVGSIQGNGGRGIQLAQNGIADYAEYMKKESSLMVPDGSLVCMQTSGMVTGCTTAQSNIVGIASPYPLIIAGENLGDGSVAVGLAGIVETRVSTASGIISPGDMIAVSEDPGVGMKAVTTGMVAGRALEGFSGGGTGRIKVIVSPQIYFASTLESEITSVEGLPPLSGADINSATISGSLNVLGRTVLAETGITGRLAVGLLSIDGLDSANGTTSASINTLSEPLRLQSYALAGVDILDGKVTIDKSGNLKIQESVAAKKYNVDTTDVRSASLGKSVLPAGETRITVETTAVTEDSAIFLTPIGEVTTPLFIAEQKQGASFTVGISKEEQKEIKFSWWVVN